MRRSAASGPGQRSACPNGCKLLADLRDFDAGELSADFEQVRETGSNKGLIALKGGTQQFQGNIQAEQWPLDDELATTAKKHEILLDRDYFCRNDPRDHRDFGMPRRGVPQAIDQRLFSPTPGLHQRESRPAPWPSCKPARRPQWLTPISMIPAAVGVLLWEEDPLALSQRAEETYGGEVVCRRHAAAGVHHAG